MVGAFFFICIYVLNTIMNRKIYNTTKHNKTKYKVLTKVKCGSKIYKTQHNALKVGKTVKG